MASEESVVIDALAVSDGRQQEVIDKLYELFEQMRSLDGFVGGEIHVSADGRTVLGYSRMRTEADRDRVEADAEMLATWGELQAIATPQREAFKLERAFYPPRGSGGVDYQGGL